jgi:hypothetical protein
MICSKLIHNGLKFRKLGSKSLIAETGFPLLDQLDKKGRRLLPLIFLADLSEILETLYS